jgi:cyclic pyranopterin phosphate synthase
VKKKLSHIDKNGLPAMVGVSEKKVTKRIAEASGTVHLNKEILKALSGDEIMTKKGPVFQTAILAGVMAAKKTHELIPLCHPIAMEDCQIKMEVKGNSVKIHSSIAVTAKTGAEMEALTAVSVAALTVYDMCKAMSHDIEISEIRLMKKTGGKRDFKRK